MDKETIKTIKCKFKSILHPEKDYEKLFSCIERTNKITFSGYHLLRLYLLKLFENDEEFPEITTKLVKQVFKILSKNSSGPKLKESSDFLMDSCDKFMKYAGLTEKFSATNLSYLLNEEETKVVVSYTNNIKLNFQKYLYQYINEIYQVPRCVKLSKKDYIKLSNEEQIKHKITNLEIAKKRKTNLEELRSVKKDLLMCTLNSDKKFEKLIKDVRENVFPKITEKTILDDVDKHPFNYLKPMLKMNQLLETKNYKMFQALPLRTDMCNKFVSLNTSAIRDIFGEIKLDKTEEISNKELWVKCFNINFRKMKIKGYAFNGLICTDGVSVSISFMKLEQLKKKHEIHIKMAKASKEAKLKIKNMTLDELNKNKKKMEELKKKHKKSINEQIRKKKEDFKKLSKDEQEEIKHNIKMKNNEFNYITEVIKDEKIREHLVQQLKKKKIVVCDPGCRAPLTMLGETGKFNYRKRRRIKDTKRIKYTKLRQSKLDKLLKNKTISGLNNLLTKTSNRTTKAEIFKNYIKTKFKLMEKIGKEKLDEYGNYLNKLKWFSYINKKRHEDTLLNEISTKYGNDATIVIGDWSKADHIKGMSSPNMGMKRLLKKKFEIYLVDEFNTSKLNYLTKEPMKNLEISVDVKDKEGVVLRTHLKKLYSVFTYQMRNKNLGVINRDYNATLNMFRIVSSVINGKGTPAEHIRGTKKTE